MISIITPSMGRPERLRKNLESVIYTTGGFDVELITVIDEDLDSLAVAAELSDKVIYRKHRQGAPSAWNDGAAIAEGDYFVLNADDVIYESGWVLAAMHIMIDELNGYGLVGFNDMSPNAKGRGTHWMMSRDFAVDYNGGYMVYPGYDHNYTDWEVERRAAAINAYRWCEGAHVPHYHPDWFKHEWDSVYERTRLHLSEDRALYDKREAAGFPDDYPARFSKR